MHTFPSQKLKSANWGVRRSHEKSKIQKLFPSGFGMGIVEGKILEEIMKSKDHW